MTSVVPMVLLIFLPVIKGQTGGQTLDSVKDCVQMCSERKKCVSLSFNSIITGRREVNIVSVNSSSQEPGCSPVNVLDNDPTSCLITELPDTEPWLLVDLGHVTTVSDVVVHTSKDVTVQHKFHDVNFELYSVDPRLNPGVEGLCCGRIDGLSACPVMLVRCSCNVIGRYLKIYVEKSEKLTICRVQVLTFTGKYDRDISGCVHGETAICKKIPRGQNIATLDKRTIQAKVDIGSTSKYAIDGNRFTCIKVTVSTKNFWAIDLGRKYNITSITLANVFNNDWIHLQNVVIATFDVFPMYVNKKQTNCTFVDGYFGATTRTFECDKPVVSQFVRVETPGKRLRLCTVEITGDPVN